MGDEIIRRAMGGMIRAAKNEDVIRFRASTDVIDRHRSIVKQEGIDASEFMRSGSGPFLWGHDSTGGLFGTPDMRNSIGKVVKISKTRFKRGNGKFGKATDIDVEFAKTKESNGPLAASLVREGVLGNVSVAFIPKAHEVQEINGEEIRVYNKTELLEVSLVPVASNPEAAHILRSIGMQAEELREEGLLADGQTDDDMGGPWRGTWFWKDGDWTRRLQPGELVERIQRVGDVEVIERFGKPDDRGVVPTDVSKTKAEEGTAWKAPTLSDFTSESWGDLSNAMRRRIVRHFAWAPSSNTEEFTFSDLKLPHHRPSDARIVFRGVSAAMGALLGARGGVDVPGADRRKIYNHLAAHYRQFDRVPPEFRSEGEPPPDNNGADTGVPEVVSDAVSDWVKAQRRA